MMTTIETVLSDVPKRKLTETETFELANTIKRCFESNDSLYSVMVISGLIRFNPTCDEVKMIRSGKQIDNFEYKVAKRVVDDVMLLSRLPSIDGVIEIYNYIVKNARKELKDYCEMFGIPTLYQPMPFGEVMPRFAVWTDDTKLVKYVQ